MKRLLIVFVMVISLAMLMSLSIMANTTEVEDNNAWESATEILVNDIASGVISDMEDTDWYKFDLPQNGYFSVSLTHEFFDSNDSYWEIRIYKDTSFICGSDTYYSCDGNSNLSTGTFGADKGAYYIKVSHPSNTYSSAQYDLLVSFTPATDWETENNNYRSQADEIKLNSPINGALTVTNDVDWYKFEVSEGGYFNIKFDHKLIDSTDTYWELSLYDSSGVNGIYGTNGTKMKLYVLGNSNFVSGNIGVDVGTYYIALSAGNSRTSRQYTMTVEFNSSNSWESEKNGSFSTADEILLNQKIYGSLSGVYDDDYYKVEVTEKGYFTVKFDHVLLPSTEKFWTFKIYDSTEINGIDGQTSEYYVSGKYNVETKTYGVAPGTYYICVSTPSGEFSTNDYSVMVSFTKSENWEEENNNTSQNATATDINKAMYGALTGDDKDWYVINVEEDIKFDLQLDLCGTTTSDKEEKVYINIYDYSAVTKLYSESYKYTKDKLIELEDVELSKGMYFIYIYIGVGEEIPKYCLFLNDGHKCDKEMVVTKEASCIFDGTKEELCKECGKSYKTESIPLGTHIGKDILVEKTATCEQDGLRHFTCIYCGEKVDEVVDKLPHRYGETKILSGNMVIPPIKSERTCQDCGYYEFNSDWSYLWLGIVVGVVSLVSFVGIIVGFFNYFKRIK